MSHLPSPLPKLQHAPLPLYSATSQGTRSDSLSFYCFQFGTHIWVPQGVGGASMNEPRRDLQLFLDTINKGALLWISSSSKFLCVWTLGYLLNAWINNKTSSLLDFSSDGTTNIIIANIRIVNQIITNIKITNIRIVNIGLTKLRYSQHRITYISLANINIIITT